MEKEKKNALNFFHFLAAFSRNEYLLIFLDLFGIAPGAETNPDIGKLEKEKEKEKEKEEGDAWRESRSLVEMKSKLVSRAHLSADAGGMPYLSFLFFIIIF